MGLNNRGTKLLLYAKKFGVNFESTTTIGRQGLHLAPTVFQQNLDEYGITNANALEILKEGKGYAEPFLSLLGASKMNSIDASTYEEATIIHDMNTPISEIYKNSCTVMIDGGSLEHVFNFPVAIKNCMEMVQLGGHYIGITPCNNFFGHGFYQFSPELYFRIFCEENGFKIEKMIFYADKKNSKWFEVSDPNEVKERVILANRFPSNLFVLAKKIEVKAIFSKTPQQSDYQHLLWEGKGNLNQIEKNQRKVSLQTKANNFWTQLKSLFYEIGDGNKRFFKNIN